MQAIFPVADEEQGLAALLARLSAVCLTLAPEQLDRGIDQGQRLVCEELGIDSSELWQADEHAEDSLLLTHLYRRSVGGPEDRPVHPTSCRASGVERSDLPVRTDAKAFFPWVFSRVRSGTGVVIESLDQLPEEATRDREALGREGIRSLVAVPLANGSRWFGLLAFGMTGEKRAWTGNEVHQLRLAGDIFANALDRIRTECARQENELKLEGEIKALKERLKSENDYLKPEVKLNQTHRDVVGQSRAIRKVLQQVEHVAPVNSPVLVTGESGTGKELIAQSIHRLSPRGGRSMIVVNCAALPSGLVESELFGRERGAFTGALSSQAGSFELADHSTIFLDEIAELPLELQGKLLRVVQQGEFARLGNPKTRKVDVRIIAATNRDLAEEVRKQRFREDLFYRLNVFPIHLPPLRERAEDIPFLVFTFLEELSVRIGKQITKVPRRVMESLERHSWPGNIRELRNVIERGVILSTGDTLRLALATNPQPAREAVTLAEVERQHILATLEKTDWRIKGPRGAARMLDVNPGTLYSRMRKLGVPHRTQKDALTT